MCDSEVLSDVSVAESCPAVEESIRYSEEREREFARTQVLKPSTKEEAVQMLVEKLRLMESVESTNGRFDELREALGLDCSNNVFKSALWKARTEGFVRFTRGDLESAKSNEGRKIKIETINGAYGARAEKRSRTRLGFAL